MAYPETAPTQAEFLAAFPEFEGVEPSLLNAALASAATMVSSCVYGRQYGIAVGYLAAHRMALSPWGNASKLSTEKGKGSTTYQLHFEEIRASVTAFGLVC
jgi:hypothetical protein